MSTNFPTSLDTLTNPTGTDPVTNPSHALQHSNANDAIEALEAKVGQNSSVVTTSHDYKLSNVTTGDKAVSLTGQETLTNKTLTSAVLTTPQINDASLDHQYLFTGSELSADRTVTLPLLTGNDEFVFKNHTQSLTNKTLNDDTNTIRANSLKSATTTISVDSATAPVTGQVLTATSDTTATWQTITSGGSTNCQLLFPSYYLNGSYTDYATTTNTTARFFKFNIYNNITVNSLTFRSSTVTTPGTVKFGFYSEDGQTKLLEVTSATINTSTTYKLSLGSSLSLTPGSYYLVVLPQSTFNGQIISYAHFNDTVSVYFNNPSSEPVLFGTKSVTANTLPTTFNPVSDITSTISLCPIIRLDN